VDEAREAKPSGPKVNGSFTTQRMGDREKGTTKNTKSTKREMDEENSVS
jgi:hypothetical protein